MTEDNGEYETVRLLAFRVGRFDQEPANVKECQSCGEQVAVSDRQVIDLPREPDEYECAVCAADRNDMGLEEFIEAKMDEMFADQDADFNVDVFFEMLEETIEQEQQDGVAA